MDSQMPPNEGLHGAGEFTGAMAVAVVGCEAVNFGGPVSGREHPCAGVELDRGPGALLVQCAGITQARVPIDPGGQVRVAEPGAALGSPWPAGVPRLWAHHRARGCLRGSSHPCP